MIPRAGLFSLQYTKVENLCRFSIHTVSLRIWQLDVTQSFLEPAMIATKQGE